MRCAEKRPVTRAHGSPPGGMSHWPASRQFGKPLIFPVCIIDFDFGVVPNAIQAPCQAPV